MSPKPLKELRRAGAIAVFPVLLFGFGMTTLASRPALASDEAPRLSPIEARKHIRETLGAALPERGEARLGLIGVSEDGLSLQAPAVGEPGSTRRHRYRLDDAFPRLSVSAGTPPGWSTVLLPDGLVLRWARPEDAQRLVNAVNAIVYHRSKERLLEDAAPFEEFRKRARAWRSFPETPETPPDAARYRVLAEEAMRGGSIDDAIDAYESILEVFPFWAEGRATAALLHGRVEQYGPGVAHLKRYLDLVPEAPDAPAAREKLEIWEGEIGR